MITTVDMKLLEELSEKYGVSRLELMETAGARIYQVLNKKFGLKGRKVLVVAYHGNNGGDGFVAARYLTKVCKVDVLFIGEEKKLKEEARKNYERMKKEKKTKIIKEISKVNFSKYDIIIDAILGTGAKGKIKGKIADAIERINASKAYKVAVDIPTGLDPDTGEIMDKAVEPDTVITFHDLKPGLQKYKKERIIVDIGIPEEAEDELKQKYN